MLLLLLTTPVLFVSGSPAIQLNGHALQLDGNGEIVTWMEQSSSMDKMVKDALHWIERQSQLL